MVGRLVSRTTFSGHLCADLIRMIVLSMISGRSGKLTGDSGKDHPAINRRNASALPTTTKYLVMGTADGSRDLSSLGQPMTAMLATPALWRVSTMMPATSLPIVFKTLP
jgi:hypothetical protein